MTRYRHVWKTSHEMPSRLENRSLCELMEDKFLGDSLNTTIGDAAQESNEFSDAPLYQYRAWHVSCDTYGLPRRYH